jgi:hypothetical protein
MDENIRETPNGNDLQSDSRSLRGLLHHSLMMFGKTAFHESDHHVKLS